VTLPISLYFVDTGIFQEYSRDVTELDEETQKDYSIFLPFAIISAYHKLKVKHVVSFHSTNKRARDFVKLVRKVIAANGTGDDKNIIASFQVK